MAINNTITYDNASNFTFSDSDKINIIASKLQLKSQASADETAFADYGASIDLRRSGGTATGTATGGAAASGGYLNLTGGGVKYVDYSATGNANSAQQGCFRLKVKFNYTGAPPSNYYILHVSEASGSRKNEISIYHKTTGDIYVDTYNSSGTILNSARFVTNLGQTAGQEFEFEYNYDFDTGTNRLFKDGVNTTGSVGVATTRTTIGLLRLGSDVSGGTSNDIEITDFQAFSSVQHTADFADEIPRAEPTTYVTTAQNALVNSASGMEEITDFSHVSGGTGTVKYRLRYGGQDYYVTGGSLTASDGSIAQSNTAAELAAAAPLDIVPDGNVQLRAVLQSSDGYTTPTVTSCTVSYNLFVAQITLSECVVYGYIVDGTTVVSNATIAITSTEPFFKDGSCISVNASDTTGADGYFAVTVPVSPSQTLNYAITYRDSKGKKQEKTGTLVVPNQISTELEDIVS